MLGMLGRTTLTTRADVLPWPILFPHSLLVADAE